MTDAERKEAANRIADLALAWLEKFFGGRAWINVHLTPPREDGARHIRINLNSQSNSKPNDRDPA